MFDSVVLPPVNAATPYFFVSLQSLPAARVDPNVKYIMSQIRQEQIGSGQFYFSGSETNINALPLVDYVVQNSEPYTERRCRLLFFKIFKALETLHRRNVVHRSIRREHIFVRVSFRRNLLRNCIA